jgi:T5SS/PEP-CTERM-associated repeat protein
MKRSIVLHECRTDAVGWLLWFIVVLCVVVLALVLAATAVGATAYFSFEGAFTNGTETQSFLFSTSAALRPPAPFTLRTWQYDGTIAPPGNAAGYPIAAGGFDSILRLYNDTPALVAENDDIGPGRDSLIDWNTAGMPPQLATDNYQLELVAYGGTLGGRLAHWAVDLVSDAAKFTFTGVDKNDLTGGTSIYSLAMGSDDVRLPATLQLDGGDSLTMSGPLVVGNTGGGVANILGTIESEFGSLGNYTGSDGAISIHTGGSWSARSLNWPTYVGWWGKGTLLVQTDGTADLSDLVVGTFPGSEGNLVVSGANAVVTVDEVLHVGYEGTGTLNVNEYGLLDSFGGGGGYADTVAMFAGSIGTVDVEGYDSRWLTNELVVGQGGHGTVRITSGGKIDTTGNAYIGRLANATGSSVTVAGMSPAFTKATWAVSGDMHIAGDEAGPSSAPLSRLAINPGGLVDVFGTTTVWNGGGNFDLLGGEMETGSLLVKPGATFTHTDGTLTVNGDTFDPGTGTGNYVITGADSADRPKVVLTNGADSVSLGPLIVGQDNYGELTIEDGATLTATNVVTSLGQTASSSGKITIQGATSLLLVTDPAVYDHYSLEVGATGPGELIVSAGGRVFVDDGGVALACCSSAAGIGTGAITIEGLDSLLEAKYVDFRAAGGDSSVTIRDNGVVRATESSYVNYIAPLSIISLNTLSVDITSGGRLELAGQLVVGGGSGDTNVSIDGASAGQAALIVGGPLSIGKSTPFDLGPALVTVANGGHVSASSVKVWQLGTIELNNGGINTGSLELAGGTLRGDGDVSLLSGQLTNAGVVAPGLSAGVLNINGDYVQDIAGRLAIEIGGTALYQFDRLQVNGSATLGGTLAVSLIDPTGGTNVFMPQVQDTFNILTAVGGLGGTTFTQELLPTLSGALYFDVFYDSQFVRLTVRAFPGDYNHNGVVDAADYVVWRKTYSGPNVPPVSLDADGDLDGDVDQHDYAVWREYFGQVYDTPAAGAGSASADASIPEPAGLVLLALACCVTVLWRERGRRRYARFGTCCHLMVLAVLICCVSICSARAGVIYDAANDFSSTNNPNGAWSYGWSASLASGLHVYPTSGTGNGLSGWYDPPITVLGAPAVFLNPTASAITAGTVNILAGQLAFHPGNLGQFSVVRWTAPLAGPAMISAIFTGRDVTPTTTDVHVLHNGAALFNGVVNSFGSGPSFDTPEIVAVLQGDTIDFAVGYGPNGTFWADTTSLDGVIEIWPAALLAGDYNQNGFVDAADYVVWRKNEGTTDPLPNDPIGGTIGQGQYDQWRAHFGQTAGRGAGAEANTTVPEPATLALLMLMTAICCIRRGRAA